MIRAATLLDLEQILALTREFVVSYPLDEAAFRANYPLLVAKEDTFFAAAQREARIVGYILGGVHLTLYANGSVGWVDEVMVHSDFRRMGIGRELMTAFENWAKKRAILVTLATRRAAPFYESLGYEQTAAYLKKELKP